MQTLQIGNPVSMEVTTLYYVRQQLQLIFFFKSETPMSLVLGGIRTQNLLISGETTKSSCLGAFGLGG